MYFRQKSSVHSNFKKHTQIKSLYWFDNTCATNTAQLNTDTILNTHGNVSRESKKIHLVVKLQINCALDQIACINGLIIRNKLTQSQAKSTTPKHHRALNDKCVSARFITLWGLMGNISVASCAMCSKICAICWCCAFLYSCCFVCVFYSCSTSRSPGHLMRLFTSILNYLYMTSKDFLIYTYYQIRGIHLNLLLEPFWFLKMSDSLAP